MYGCFIGKFVMGIVDDVGFWMYFCDCVGVDDVVGFVG